MQDVYEVMAIQKQEAERKARADLKARVADGYQPTEEEEKAGQKLMSAAEFMERGARAVSPRVRRAAAQRTAGPDAESAARGRATGAEKAARGFGGHR